jgi:hypothetical protein
VYVVGATGIEPVTAVAAVPMPPKENDFTNNF